MSGLRKLPVLLALAILASSVQAQQQYIGYVYPAGGQQGSTFQIKLGGQKLATPSGLAVSGDGVSVRLIYFYRPLNNQELRLLRNQLKELQKKDTILGDAMAARMAWFELPARIEPPELDGLICPSCSALNPFGATACSDCNAPLTAMKKPKPPKKSGAPKTEKGIAKQNLIEHIQRILAEDERNPAVRAHTELVFAEVTVAADAKPGRRDIRVISKSGVSNPLAFYVGQAPEVTRKPMKTCNKPVLGKEELALRKRPPSEEVVYITPPCTMNGQIAGGEVNRYRFAAKKGRRLVISCKARQLVPYVADGVPGWFQAVLRLTDVQGEEVAYNDDYRFNPDPTLYYEVPEDGDYVLTINDALYRGRESFTYRITIAEAPFVTSVFPLGGRVGETRKIEMSGWNLEGATLSPPPKDAKPGRHLVAAAKGKLLSNAVPFVLDTLPECLDREPNDQPAKAQKVKLPIIVNGRSDRPGDWDVFEVEGKTSDSVVVEVNARRLGSPFDSFVKITNEDGKIIAMNDDHHDAASGLNTDHADSYLMIELPADGKYFIHLGDTRRHAGKEYAYRLRISHSRPDFELRAVPSRIIMRSRSSASVTVYAIRKDGFNGQIELKPENLPAGFTSSGAKIAADKESVKLTVKTTLTDMEEPVNISIIGRAKDRDREIVRAAVPAEDQMQAFLWRHLLPADNLPLLVYNPSEKPLVNRLRPPIADKARPKDVKSTLKLSQVDSYMRQIERLYQQWLLTDAFTNREIAKIEAQLIK